MHSVLPQLADEQDCFFSIHQFQNLICRLIVLVFVDTFLCNTKILILWLSGSLLRLSHLNFSHKIFWVNFALLIYIRLPYSRPSRLVCVQLRFVDNGTWLCNALLGIFHWNIIYIYVQYRQRNIIILVSALRPVRRRH